MTAPVGEAFNGAQINTNPEQQHIPQTFEEAFEASRKDLYAMLGDPDLAAVHTERGIDVTDSNRPAYWATVSDFARRNADKQRETGVDERTIAVTELCASTADFVFNQYALDQTRDKHDPRSRQISGRAKRVVSDYNDMIRNVAEQFPDVRVSQLSEKLSDVANLTIEHPALLHSSPKYINSAVRGAQFEVAFKNILDFAGYKNHDATIDQDVRGIDRIVTLKNGTVITVDVKASTHAFNKLHGSARLGGLTYHWQRGNKLTLYPNIGDEQLQDFFHVNERVAADRAVKLETIFATVPSVHAGRHTVRSAVR